MSFDFQKLGLDRMATGIARSVTGGQSTLSTGDITKGTIVEVVIDGGTTGSATVSARRTGAIPISVEISGASPLCEYKWSIEGTTLSVQLNAGRDVTIQFWVF